MHPAQIALFALSGLCMLIASAPWWEDAWSYWRERRAINNRRKGERNAK